MREFVISRDIYVRRAYKSQTLNRVHIYKQRFFIYKFLRRQIIHLLPAVLHRICSRRLCCREFDCYMFSYTTLFLLIRERSGYRRCNYVDGSWRRRF
ncbi:hypothetical protein QVD17_27401 [Tagetes erecta]|uniref:Uncharacterized protein n=1 Tax=Tagetes erecta TaxID=13708 RepID=A0AAD8K906_TARER|nr:hypothetical protein QVD17_27401 [Tagetes erecta]